MSWQIRIPHRHRDEMIVSVVDTAGEALAGEEATVTRQLAFDALRRGTTRVGELLDELEAAGPEGRRALLDRARRGAGLPTTGEVEALSRAEARERATLADVSAGRDQRGRPQPDEGADRRR
jgi:hypothetical protein